MTTNSSNANTPSRQVPSLAEDLAAMASRRPGPRSAGVPASGSRTADTAQPRMFGQRVYVLPDTVQSDIPRRAVAGEYGRWTYARAVLVEICDALQYTPVALYDRLCTDSIGNPAAVVITVIARDENDEIVTVVWRQDRGLNGHGPNGWELTINGAVPDGGTGRLRPSPPMLADIIRRAITN